MNKLFFSLTFLIVVIVTGGYSLLFTSWGNNIVAGIIEDKANQNENVNFKVEKFELTMSSVDFIANIDNNSYITVKGDLALLAQEFDLNYDVNVKELSKLNKLTNANLKGPLNTQGSVKGNSELLNIKGTSDVFDSSTTYATTLVNFEPSDIAFTITKAKIDKLLYMLNQPNYAKGFVSIDGKIKQMQGQIKTTVFDGKVNNPVVNEAFNQKLLRPLTFNGEVITDISKEQAISKIDFFTTMANLFVKKAQVTFSDASIVSDYTLKVDDLSKLYDVAQMKMRGKVSINGEIKKDKNLLVTGSSKLLDGMINFKLLNNDFTSTIKNVELLQALHMLYYPEVFTSKTDLSLSYNLTSKKGLLQGQLNDGQFKQNKFSALLNTFAKFDITKEVYESVVLKSDINKDIVQSTLNMKSKLTTIEVPHSTINTKTRTADALVKTTLKGVSFDTKISGSLDKPNIEMDTKKFLINNEKVKKETQRLQRKIEEKLGKDAGGLLKGLFQ